MKIIEVQSCQSCPFCGEDNEYGYQYCNISDDPSDQAFKEQGSWWQLPKDKRHELCPLEEQPITVKAKQ